MLCSFVSAYLRAAGSGAGVARLTDRDRTQIEARRTVTEASDETQLAGVSIAVLVVLVVLAFTVDCRYVNANVYFDLALALALALALDLDLGVGVLAIAHLLGPLLFCDSLSFTSLAVSVSVSLLGGAERK